MLINNFYLLYIIKLYQLDSTSNNFHSVCLEYQGDSLIVNYECVILTGKSLNVSENVDILHHNKLIKDLPVICIGTYEECNNCSKILKRNKIADPEENSSNFSEVFYKKILIIFKLDVNLLMIIAL